MRRHEHPARDAALAALQAETLDVLVVGGGIVGAGVARDAAMRGLRTGLVEQYDLAFGTSSRSSRLLHGGLRYLAQGRIGLVYEASQEKRILHRIAPHLARPLEFLFPTYRGSGWPRWQLRVGVKLYDLLCWGKNMGPSGSLSRGQTLARLPGLSPEGLTGAVSYYDGLTADARLVLDTLRSAAAAGAAVVSYAKAESPRRNGSAWRIAIRDTLAQGTSEVAARCVIHATGPWAERLAPSGVRLRLTKGVHLVVDRARIDCDAALVLAEGSRIVFMLPWGERLVLGTTDTDYQGEIEAVHTEREDVRYLLELADRHFPEAELTERAVLATWAGLRPLIYSGCGGPSDISRAHQIREPQPGWIDVAGGKLTTYRRIAEQAVDRAAARAGRSIAPCRTAQEPLLAEPDAARFSGILPPELRREAVEHYCTREWAVHLDDVMVRRSSWHYYLPDSSSASRQVARWMGELLGWSDEEREKELARYDETIH